MKRILGCLLLAVAAFAAETPQELFEKGLVKERSEGDLKEAIQLYERAAETAGKNRMLAVKALLEAGECYRKLGDAEARKLFDRVIREYPDQKEAVAVARMHLGKVPASSSSRMSFRQIWELPSRGFLAGPISRDGRYLAYVDWGHGDLFLHDFSSDSNRRLTDGATVGLPGPKIEQYAEEASLSRDGRHVAFNWWRSDHDRTELRLIEIKGDGIPQSRLLLDNPDVEWIEPGGWSPDGKLIAVMLQRKDKTGQIALVSVSDGTLRLLKSVDWRGAQSITFSPDGKYLAYDLPAGDNSEQRDIFVLATDGSREVPAVVSPSQDIVVGWSDDGKRLLFASDRSGSMTLWSLPFVNGKVDGPPELLRRDIGQFWRLNFAQGRLHGVVHVQNSGLSIAGDVYTAAADFATEKLLSPAFLAVQTYVGNNNFPAWSRDGKYLAYASRRGSPGPEYFIIAIRSLETGEVREVSPSPGLKGLYALAWSPDGRSLIAMGADTKGRHGIFNVDVQTSRTSVLILKDWKGAHPVPAGISPDGTKLYYGKLLLAGEERGDAVWIEKDLTAGSERELLRAPKWGPGAALPPDGQYLVIGGVDPAKPGLFLLPIAGGEPRRLPQLTGVLPVPLEWAADSRALYFLKAPAEVWRLPIDGGEPRKVNLRFEGSGLKIWALRVHPDGKQIAFQTPLASKPDEVWVLDNLLPTLTAGK
jgi:Tol biopolymer transport system component